MIIAQCVLVTLAAALVLVHSTSSSTPIMPMTTVLPTLTTSPQATFTEPATIHGTATDKLTTLSSVESTATMTNGFVFTSTWILVIAVGGFTLLTAMPLLIIMILIVALGCTCKKYKRMKKRLIAPTEIVASNNYYGEVPTAMESDVERRNIICLDDIDTGENVAYGQTTAVVERCNAADNIVMTMQNAETDRQSSESSSNNVAMVEDTGHDRMSTEVKGRDDTNTEDDTRETNVETDYGSYVINDLYDSIT